MIFFFNIVAQITFVESVYSTMEDNGLTQPSQFIQPQLSLSILSSFDITIRVNTDSINATTGGPTGEVLSARSFKYA